MAHVREPPDPKPVDVRDVGSVPVPFLRPFEWIATAFKTFREKPLPASYTTQGQPTFDLFGTSKLPEYGVEVIAGGVGNIEVLTPRIDGTKWRQYLSVDVVHDDGGVAHEIRFVRVVQDSTLGFPSLAFAVSPAILDGVHFTARNVSVPPDGRIGAEIDVIGIGGQLFLRTLFVEFAVGEPYGAIS